MKNNPIFNFIFTLTIAVAVVFGVHLFALNYLGQALFANQIILAYAVNYFLALQIGIIIYQMRNKYTSSLGFIFLGGSMLKFFVFFLLFYSGYHADGEVSTLEFTTLFIPYGVSLIVETTFLIRVLNRMGEQ